MKLGIIQGRLSLPENGYQDCPSNWKAEFYKLKSLDLIHIEWIVTKNSFKHNPFFFENLKNFSINAVCADNLIDENFLEIEFIKNQIYPICESCIKNNIKAVTLPLLEKSKITNNNKKESFIKILHKLIEKFPKLIFSVEADLDLYNLFDIIKIDNNVKVTYDTGNITYSRFNHKMYLRKTMDKISNIHIKDRSFNGESKKPLLGDTNFYEIFAYLKQNNYNGVFTLQTTREKTGDEFKTIKNHINIIRKIYEKFI